MVIGKILNNNVVVSTNDAGEEVILMGRGLAFKKKIGDVIDEDYVEKEFILKDSFTANQFQQLFADIPVEEVEAVKQVVDEAEQVLGIELSPNIYLTLTDHIHYALVRAREGIEIPNPLLFETRKFYPKEYMVATKAVARFERDFDVSLPEAEKGFIAFHIVNSEQANGTMETTMQAVEIVRDVLAIISRFYGKVFNPDSLNYQRITTHLQYFAQRYLSDELPEEKDEFLFELIQSKYPKAFQTVQRINDYLIKTYGKPIGESEMIYLTIHIERVVNDI
jgi:beta-glucoside operon transcriptional antiterminator